MTLLQAIANADRLRPNDISDEVKASWIHNLEGEIAELQEVDLPENTFPVDSELLMPSPHDNIYELYLCAMVDNANEEITLYANDSVMFNSALTDAKAYWRRNHEHSDSGYWRF